MLTLAMSTTSPAFGNGDKEDPDAFDHEMWKGEVAARLRKLADQIAGDEITDDAIIVDSNGHIVGHVHLDSQVESTGDRARTYMVVGVNLDPTPGTMGTSESARDIVWRCLDERLSHYRPRVEALTEDRAR